MRCIRITNKCCRRGRARVMCSRARTPSKPQARNIFHGSRTKRTTNMSRTKRVQHSSMPRRELRTATFGRLQNQIQELHGRSAQHVESVRVTEMFRGNKTWQGTVEVFDVAGHPKAKRAYCWSHLKGMHDSRREIVAILGLLPVGSALAALRTWIVSDVQHDKR